MPNEKAKYYVSMVQTCLDELRNGRSIEGQLNSLKTVSKSEFWGAINSDASKKAFWINAYNVFNLVGMTKRQPKSAWDRWRHFSRRDFCIAGIRLSLNDIEHGILRRSKFWWAAGWLQNPFPTKVMRALQLEKDDPRIHFALNCGANGCPSIRFYTAAAVEEELDLATKGFMNLEVQAENGVIWVSAIFKMYLGDFGGKRGLRAWLHHFRSDLEIDKMPIRFRSYDWTVNLQKFID